MEQSVSNIYPEQEARDLMPHLLQADQYMHSHDVVHRDLKLRNFIHQTMEQGMMFKICDFGLARRVHAPRTVTRFCGTPNYMAPEVWKQIPYDQSADMWSVGVILYMLLFGCPPFEGETTVAVGERVRLGEYSFPSDDAVSNEAKELIRGLLVVEPMKRLTAEEALRSSWIQQNDVKEKKAEKSKGTPKHETFKKKKSSSFLSPFKWKSNKTVTSKKTTSEQSDSDSIRIVV